jgi:hypothetical protein
MEYNIRDRVISLVPVGSERIKNAIGEVLAFVKGDYGVEFDNYIDGHNCTGRGKSGHCWWINEYNLKPYNLNRRIK